MSTSEISICTICSDNSATHAIIPCGHFCICFSCLTTLKNTSTDPRCPCCRGPITNSLRIYNSTNSSHIDSTDTDKLSELKDNLTFLSEENKKLKENIYNIKTDYNNLKDMVNFLKHVLPGFFEEINYRIPNLQGDVGLVPNSEID